MLASTGGPHASDRAPRRRVTDRRRRIRLPRTIHRRPGPRMHVITGSDGRVPSPYEMAVTDGLAVELRGNAGTGYEWQVVAIPPMLRQLDPATSACIGESIPGCAQLTIFEFDILAPGEGPSGSSTPGHGRRASRRCRRSRSRCAFTETAIRRYREGRPLRSGPRTRRIPNGRAGESNPHMMPIRVGRGRSETLFLRGFSRRVAREAGSAGGFRARAVARMPPRSRFAPCLLARRSGL
jgi:hypothetical protein